MPDRLSSFFRRGSARVLVCGVLLSAALLLARQHVLAALSALIVVAFAGGLRRFQEQASRRTQASGQTLNTHGDSQPAVPPPAQSSIAARQTLEERVDAEWKRGQAAAEPTALLLIEVDALSQLADHSGALAAEVAMLTTASALASMLPRGADLLARYDERTFAVLLRGTDLPGSLRVAARLRWSIVRLGIAHPHTQSGFLTASMGLAVQHQALADGTAALLHAAAEGALSRARQLGHDRLEYVELGEEHHPEYLLAQSAPTGASPAAIRAWTPEPLPAFHSQQG